MRYSFVAALVLLMALSPWTPAWSAPRPKLVVLVAIDQFRSDYLTRFSHQFLPPTRGSRPGGFRYLTTKGATFRNARTAHAPNTTAVGHATMLTGALPYQHGIVSNAWWDHGLAKESSSVGDAESQIVGTAPGKPGRSPRTLLATTVGDELKNAMGGKPRVVSIALKDRAAILMGGRRADLALWYDESVMGLVTSSYYAKDGKLPAWVEAWNRQDYLGKRVPRKWTLLLDKSSYSLSTPMPDDATGDGRGLGKAFPHPIEKKVGAFLTSPWANAYVLDAGLHAVRALKLGASTAPDLLALSLSAFDALGHNYGPMSIEMQDAALRLDRMLSDFLAALAGAVPGGLSGVMLVLVADHGVQVNPVYARKAGLPGGPFSSIELIEKANEHLRGKFGFGKDDKPIVHSYAGNLWLDHSLLRDNGKELLEVSRATAAWLRKRPELVAAYAREDVLEGRLPPTQVARKIAVSVHPERSGDVIFAERPGHIAMDSHGFGGADHSSPASAHDAAIPLVFVGPQFSPGTHYDAVQLIDLAPTLSAVLGIVPPSASEGKVLTQALTR